MIEMLRSSVEGAFGLGADSLTIWQVAVRGAVIYGAALVLMRVGGDRRFIGRHAAMDVLLGIILGSTLSRAINSAVPFVGTLLSAAVLVGLHALFSAIAVRFKALDPLLKGCAQTLIEDGEVNPRAMKANHISRNDLEESMRLKAKLTDPQQVKLALLECNGQISIIPKTSSPQIVEVNVEEGVQTVRIQIN